MTDHRLWTVTALVAITLYSVFKFEKSTKKERDTSTDMLRKMKKALPVLNSSHHKGQHGKVMVVGGSFEYTGAPFYAGISTLKSGSELCYVLCHKLAGIPLKTYSPELMVMPSMTDEMNPKTFVKENNLLPLLKRLTCLVAGPGLGRSQNTLDTVREILNTAKAVNIPLIIDGDALFMLHQANNVNMFHDYDKVILTPNAMEFRRLWVGAFQGEQEPPPFDVSSELKEEGDKEFTYDTHFQDIRDTMDLSRKLGGVTILRKGIVDIISNGEVSILSSGFSSPRRCGGQGDVLAGLAATWYSWSGDPLLSAYAASYLLRKIAESTFEKKGRGMLVTDIIDQLPENIAKFEKNIAKL